MNLSFSTHLALAPKFGARKFTKEELKEAVAQIREEARLEKQNALSVADLLKIVLAHQGIQTKVTLAESLQTPEFGEPRNYRLCLTYGYHDHPQDWVKTLAKIPGMKLLAASANVEKNEGQEMFEWDISNVPGLPDTAQKVYRGIIQDDDIGNW